MDRVSIEDFFCVSVSKRADANDGTIQPNFGARIKMEPQQVRDAAQRIQENVARVIVGKDETITLLLVALLCEGHILLEDVPGIGKTTLAKALAKSLGCSFQRIQFTPDLLPSDITGVNVFNQRTNNFEYRAGPLLSQIVLADEINRAGPRTQAALLEAMEERQVTVDGVTHLLPRPFLVLATQNPVELEGTFPLPEAQVDRFLMRVAIGYPDEDEERAILRRFRENNPLTELEPVIAASEILALQRAVREVFVHPAVEEYIVRLTRTTREHDAIQLGASPRGSLALYRTAQALAAMRGRSFVLPDDVKHLLAPVLEHRILTTSQARVRGRGVRDILQDVAARVPVPVEESWSVETGQVIPAQ
jgi:MoxR-like ATPase